MVVSGDCRQVQNLYEDIFGHETEAYPTLWPPQSIGGERQADFFWFSGVRLKSVKGECCCVCACFLLFLLVAFGAARTTVKSHYARDEGKTIARIRGARLRPMKLCGMRAFGRAAHGPMRSVPAPVRTQNRNNARTRVCVCVREKLGERVCCVQMFCFIGMRCRHALLRERGAHH